jgi:pimeloyl-ACP methyl ester carboxylesterase
VPQDERVSRRRPAALVLLGALLLAACSGGDDPAATAVPSEPPPASAEPTPTPEPIPTPEPEPVPVALEWTPCKAGFECATLPAPLDRSDPAAGTVDLALTRRLAGDSSQRIGSLVVNPGGPGSSAVGYLQRAWKAVPQPVRTRFDLVAFDPRGVGESAPVRCLGTEQMDEIVALDPDPDDAAELQALEDGARRMADACQAQAGSVLPHVSTEQAARDLDLLRASLGDAGLTYLGYSYGTSIGTEYLRLFPTRVRAMVLDSPLDPTLTWEQVLEGQANGFDVALGAFLEHCEQTGCAFRKAVEGDLGAAFDALAARVEQSPLPGDGRRTVGPGEFSLGVGAGLYSRDNGWPAVAEGLAQAQGGDGSVLLALSDAYLDRTEEGYANTSEANLAVNCLDRPWPRETAPYLALAERVRATAPRFGPAIALSGLGCSVWPVEPQRTPAPVRAETAPPVVLVAVTRDPATPYAWAEGLAAQLATGVLVTLDGDGHTAYRAGGRKCVREVVDAYLVDLAVPPATRC